MEISLKRRDDKLYKRKAFTIKQGKEKVGFLLPGEVKSFTIDERQPVKIEIDSFTGSLIKTENILQHKDWEIIPDSRLAFTPMIWTTLLVLAILIPLVSEDAGGWTPYALGILLLTYLPLITIFKNSWLKVNPLD